MHVRSTADACRAMAGIGAARVEYCGESFPVPPDRGITLGRRADLTIDAANNRLAECALRILGRDGLWMLHNEAGASSVAIADADRRFQAWLAAGQRVPLVFGHTVAVFTAGLTTYEVDLFIERPVYIDGRWAAEALLTAPVGISLTASQRLLVVALAAPVLVRRGGGIGDLPTSKAAASRLGWTITRFNRKLDNVCDKLDRLGVEGLRGGAGAYATNRRIRLVEYAVATRLVTAADLDLLPRDRPC